MQQPLNQILKIIFQHHYFSNNQFKSLQLSFDKDTERLIVNLGIMIKIFPGGLHLMASEPELLEASDELGPIRLQLNCNDSRFVNYTELPAYSISNHILYFNNMNNGAPQKNNRYFLHEKEFANQQDIVPVTHGKITIPEFNAKKKYVFTGAAGEEIAPQCIRQSRPDSGNFVLYDFPEGIVEVKEGKKAITKVYHSPNPVWKKPLGILEIFPGQLYTHLKEKGKAEYIVSFNNRQTIWKYFLVSPAYQKFDNLTIINKSKEPAFKKPVKQSVHDELEALVFESNNKIPIEEHSNGFQLIEGYDPKLKSGKVILKHLATASPDLLYRDETNSGEAIYSHIFI